MNDQEEVLSLHKKLLEQEIHNFPKCGKVNVSKEQGVYIIYTLENSVLHVGRNLWGRDGLNQRLQDHLKNQSSFSRLYLKPMLIDLRNEGKFRFLEVRNERLRALVEALTIGLLCPAHLGTGAKK